MYTHRHTSSSRKMSVRDRQMIPHLPYHKTGIAVILLLALSLSAFAQTEEYLTFEVLTPTEVISACEEAEFDIELGNFGDFIERYTLSVNTFEDRTFFSDNPVEIIPGNTKKITVSVRPPCNIYGRHPITLRVTNDNLGTVYQDVLELDISSDDIPLIAEGFDTLEVGYESSQLEIPVRNMGDVDTVYDLSIEGEDFLTLTASQLTVPAGQTRSIKVLSSPSNETIEGDYTLTLVTKVRRSGLEYGKEFTVVLSSPGFIAQAIEDYGRYAYGALALIILLIIGGVVLALHLHATKEERAVRREEKRKARELKAAEKQKEREQRAHEKEQARLAKEQERETRRKEQEAEKEARAKAKEADAKAREAEREALAKEKEELALENKRSAYKSHLQSSLSDEFVYLDQETLNPVRSSILPWIVAILVLLGLGVLTYVLRDSVMPYLWYVVGGVLIAVLIVLVILIIRRSMAQRLSTFFEECGEHQMLRNQAIDELKESVHLLEKQSLDGMKSQVSLGIAPVFFVAFSIIAGLCAYLWFRGSFGAYSLYGLYAIAGFGALALVFLLITLAKLAKRKKSFKLLKLGQISAGRSYPLMISSRAGFGELILRPKIPCDAVFIGIHHHSAPPTFVQPSWQVFRSFTVSAAGMTDKDLEKSTIRFSVPKRWLARHAIDSSSVRLERYGSNRWIGVSEVDCVGEDDSTVTYEAVCNALGTFAITGKASTVKVAVAPKKEIAVSEKPSSKKNENSESVKEKVTVSRKSAAKPQKRKKESEETDGSRWLNVLLTLFFVLIALAIAGILVYAWFDDLGPIPGDNTDLTGATTTTETLTDTIAGIDAAQAKTGIEPISFVAENDHRLDLGIYFKDPDENDTLSFSHTGGEHLLITYTGAVASITNAPGYSGTDIVVFVATDSDGQTVQSNPVAVTVQEPSGFGAVGHFFAGPAGYAVLGLAIVVLVILGLEMRKRLQSEDNEEEN